MPIYVRQVKDGPRAYEDVHDLPDDGAAGEFARGTARTLTQAFAGPRSGEPPRGEVTMTDRDDRLVISLSLAN
jgi:hypothetical protein